VVVLVTEKAFPKGGGGTANLTTLCASAIVRAKDNTDGGASQLGDLIHYF